MAMISSEKALELVAHLTDEQLRASVSDAFIRRRFLPTGARGDDQPEDLYIGLLSTQRDAAVLNGCIDVFSALAPSLFASVPTLTQSDSDTLFHLMALIGVTHPDALQGHTLGILQLVLKETVPKTIRNPIVRASLGYARTENDARFWEPLIGENLVPGYAFKALLQINPHARRIQSHLISLWKRKLRGELTIEVAPLTSDASNARGGDLELIANVINEIWLTGPQWREALKRDLDRYPWSRNWITYRPATGHIKKPVKRKISKIRKCKLSSHLAGFNEQVLRRVASHPFDVHAATRSASNLLTYRILAQYVPGAHTIPAVPIEHAIPNIDSQKWSMIFEKEEPKSYKNLWSYWSNFDGKISESRVTHSTASAKDIKVLAHVNIAVNINQRKIISRRIKHHEPSPS